MTKRELMGLLLNKEVFHHVSYLLVSLGLVEKPSDDDPTPNRLILTDSGKTLLGLKTLAATPEFVRAYRDLFPPYKKGDKNLVAENLSWLMNTHGLNEQQITSATNAYLRTVEDPKFCQQADFLIYKNLPGGVIRNTILNFLDEIQKEEEGYGWEVV